MDPIHILNKSGILKSFSVAKKVTEKEIISFYKKNKKLGKSDDEIGDLLQKKIYSDIEYAIKTEKIPGVISPNFIMNKDKDKKIPLNLDRLIMVVSQKLKEKKYDKMSLCYFINSLVNIMGLGEKDFNDFHNDPADENEDDEDDGDENPYSDDSEEED